MYPIWQVSEEWVDEDKLELWEVRQYGERTERATPVTRTSTGKLPPRAPPPNASDIKDKMEQQLREQRAAHQQKRALEMAQGLEMPILLSCYLNTLIFYIGNRACSMISYRYRWLKFIDLSYKIII